VQAVKRVLSEVSRSDVIEAFPAFAPERLDATTHFFLDLIVSRFFMRALFGEDLAQLRTEIAPHVTESVAFFLAACRRES
jgi:hypothetical protein